MNTDTGLSAVEHAAIIGADKLSPTIVCIHARRSDLRGIVTLLRRGEYDNALESRAAVFGDADGLDAQALASSLDEFFDEFENQRIELEDLRDAMKDLRGAIAYGAVSATAPAVADVADATPAPTQ